MSVCNYVQPILPSECIGDSLLTINANFSALDEVLCDIPFLEAGTGAKVVSRLTEQGKNIETVTTRNSFEYKTKFDSYFVASIRDYPLADGTQLQAVEFPYVQVSTSGKPAVTFTALTQTDKIPQVTLFWLASGSDALTTYATNSARSPQDRGAVWTNGSVTALHTLNDLLFIGGDFTEVGEQTARKLAIIDLNTGEPVPPLGTTGELVSIPFAAGGDLGLVGTVNAIETTTVGGNSFIAIGGSFQSASKGRGLCIANTTNGAYYPFYVNGEVKSLHVRGSSLYVGGTFDYINYSPNSASIISGLRVLCKGLVKIDLFTLPLVPDQSIDRNFAETVRRLFEDGSEIFTITSFGSDVFVGGSFRIRGGTLDNTTAQNVVAINDSGVQNLLWRPILSGPVYTLLVDNNTFTGGGVVLYVGGDFTRCFTDSQFYSTPRENSASTFCNNVVAVNVLSNFTFDTAWRPRFNKPVTKMVSHDNNQNTYVYCYGKFTQVNDEAVAYLAALNKAFNSSIAVEVQIWKPFAQVAPNIHNNALLRYGNSIIVGGNFRQLGRSFRYGYARISGVSESISTTPLSAFAWDFGSQIVSQGMPFNTNQTIVTRVTAIPGPFDTVNCTTFPVDTQAFRSIEEGQLCRFFLRRPSNSNVIGDLPPTDDTFKQPVYVVGWKVDYNY